MAAHASDWSDSLNQRCGGGQTEHHGNDVCVGSCVDARQNSRTIPTVENLWSGSFSFPSKGFLLLIRTFRTQIVVKLLYPKPRIKNKIGWQNWFNSLLLHQKKYAGPPNWCRQHQHLVPISSRDEFEGKEIKEKCLLVLLTPGRWNRTECVFGGIDHFPPM